MWKLKNNKESKKTNGLLIGGSYVFSSKQMAYMLYPLDEMKKKGYVLLFKCILAYRF